MVRQRPRGQLRRAAGVQVQGVRGLPSAAVAADWAPSPPSGPPTLDKNLGRGDVEDYPILLDLSEADVHELFTKLFMFTGS